MFKNLNLTQKVITSVAVVLLTTSLLSFWITEAPVNRQADAAFLDKVRQITGMAATTRIWFSQNIEKLVPNHDYKYLHLEKLSVQLQEVVRKFKLRPKQERASSSTRNFGVEGTHGVEYEESSVS